VNCIYFLILFLLTNPIARADPIDTFNEFFTDEWGPTQFNSASHPDGYADCGPASLLMAAAYFGLRGPITPEMAESEIRDVRNLTRGKLTPVSGPTYSPMMIRGASALRARVTRIGANAANVAAAIKSGALVLMAGDPRTSWGFKLDSEGKYLHHYGAPGPILPPANGVGDVDHFGHWVVAFGTSADGEFYVGDPLSTIGIIEVTGTAIDQYFSEWPFMTDALAISKL
jgi:hypothetical protein